MADVKFVHPAGDVELRKVEVAIEDGVAAITGFVTPDVWDHVENEDVFGARSRSRDGSVVGDGDVRITIRGSETAMSAGPYARDWMIVDAQRRLEGAPGDGEVWTGTVFAEPRAWARAAGALDETGYAMSDSSGIEASFVGANGINVHVMADAESRIGHVLATTDIGPCNGSGRTELLEALNSLNNRFPFGNWSYADGTFALKGGVPIPEGVDVSEILEALSYALPGIAEMTADALRSVASGTKSAADAISEVFG